MATGRPSTVYLWELAWILPSIALPVGMLAALAVTAFGAGINVAGDRGRIDPTKVAEHALFREPGVAELAPGQYDVRMTGQIWAFAPNEVRVLAGSTVHFWATSKDLVHGLFVPRRNVNVMLLPGQISAAQARFDTPGAYPIIWHEYCGLAHHTMAGKISVEARRSRGPRSAWPPRP